MPHGHNSRMHLSRLRHGSSASSSLISPQPMTQQSNMHGNHPQGQMGNEFVGQDFVDTISPMQRDANQPSNCYVKMAADSTTGPDGESKYQDADFDDTNTDVTLPSMPMYSGSRGGRAAPPTPQPTFQQHHMVNSNANMISTPHMQQHNYMQGSPHHQQVQQHPQQMMASGLPHQGQQHMQNNSAIDRMSSMLLKLDTDGKYRSQN